jgi:predicted nucleic acid-binding protein
LVRHLRRYRALISPHGAPDTIYRAWRAARFEVVTSRIQLDEIRRASRYSKLQAILQPAKVGVMINNLQWARVLERLTIEVEADDPNDSFLLATALAGDADYQVTSDRRAGLLQRRYIERTRIVTPPAFCAEVL